MRYYAVQEQAKDEDYPIVLAEYADRDDGDNAGFAGVKILSTDEMQNSVELSAALNLWQHPDEHHRSYVVNEWRRKRGHNEFRMRVEDGAGELREFAFPAEPYAEDDPTIALGIAAWKALRALAEAIDPEVAELSGASVLTLTPSHVN